MGHAPAGRDKLQAYGQAGLRHVVPFIALAVVSGEAANFSVRAMAEIAQALTSGE